MKRFRVAIVLLSLSVLVVGALIYAGCPGGNESIKCETPIVDAGDDLTGEVGKPVILICGVTLPPENQDVCKDEKNAVQVRWEQNGGPDVTLDGDDQPQATFTPTEASADYKFCCTATYPVTKLNKEPKVSQPDCVNVDVGATVCPPPTANAGSDQQLATPAGTPLTAALDGSRSTAASGAGCELSIQTWAWTVVEQPAGADVTVANADQAAATVELSVFGSYTFQLEVADNGGTEDGRENTSTDTVTVSLEEKAGCEAALAVTVIQAASGAAMSGVGVTVVDAADVSHQKTTDASGVATFSGLAAGARKSITAKSSETVAPMPGAAGGDRPKYETTTVLDHCSDKITIPVRLSGSGQAAQPKGVVVGKVPAKIFDMLPHSWKCSGDCTTDANCLNTEYCETSTAPCVGKCTPKSLLPFFSLGDANISGQMRVAIMMRVLPVDNFSRFDPKNLFAKPPTATAVLPGNLTTDDTFLNGLGPTLGLDPWGQDCVRTADCPNQTDYVCEQDSAGDSRCKDKNPMRNLRAEVSAGQNVPIALLLGVMNISMVDLLPTLLPFLTGGDGAEITFDVGSMLGAFKCRTLHVCILKVNVTAGQDNNIEAALEALTQSDCYSVEYQQQEVIEPVRDENSIRPENECATDEDCGWPTSGKKCRPDPQNPTKKYCFTPMFRVQILSPDEVTVYPDTDTGFNPYEMKSDARVCAHLPATARHEKKCPDANNMPVTCDGGPVYCDITVNPDNTECAWSYGLNLAALDFPQGHDKLPAGGRVLIGFNFNRTPIAAEPNPRYLVPPLGSTGGAALSAVQLLVRYITTMPDGSYVSMTGHMGASARRASSVSMLELPAFMPPIDPGALPDAGFKVKVSIIPEDVFAECGSVVAEKTYAVATGMQEPQASHALPASPSESGLTAAGLKGLVLTRVDWDQAEGAAYRDPMWRVYAPAGTTSFAIPQSQSPFTAGQEIWLQFWGGSFDAPFDFDLFPTDMLLRQQTVSADDDWALKKG